MAKLGYGINPLLKDCVLIRLRKWKINNIVDFLKENPEKIVKIASLPYKDVIQIRQGIISKFSAFPRNGMYVYNDLLTNSALISTGIESLDNLLDGGFLTGKIYELCGPSGSGKTQLCFTVLTNVAYNFKQRLHYIDTKNDFSGKRILDMLVARNYTDEEIGAVMDKIQVTRVQDIHELFSFLHNLKGTLHHEEDDDDQHSVRIIILDSLAILFFPFLGENCTDGYGLVEELSQMMRYIAAEHHVMFLVINLTIDYTENVIGMENICQESDSEKTMKPAIGNCWSDAPCTRLLINEIDSTETREITVIKSTYLPMAKQCKVMIDAKGVITI